jgi:WD40 repeat protein/tetratricopeptide (TPR) repeat protein
VALSWYPIQKRFTMNNDDSRCRHDAFISYSRKDMAFARVLEKALENFRMPKGVSIPQRHLDIFRDESDLTGSTYYDSIEHHLQDSATLIVICSPESARSAYVDDEIRRFAGGDLKRRQRTIALLYRGIPNNEAAPGQDAEKAFSPQLCELLTMPLAIDYRGFDPAKHKLNKGLYSNSWYSLLANICGLSRAEIETRERKRQSRNRVLRIGVVSGVLAALSIALVFTLLSRQDAIRERDLAVSGQLSADALNWLSRDPQLSLLLGFEAAMVGYSTNGVVSVEVQDALHRGLEAQRQKLRIFATHGVVRAVAFSPDRRLLATADELEGIQLWDTISGIALPIRFESSSSAPLGLAFSPDGKELATAGGDDAARLLDVHSGKLVRAFRGHKNRVWSVAFSADGTRLATASGDTTAKLWDVQSGRELMTFSGHTGEVNAVAISHDGMVLATASSDKSTRVWDIKSGRQLYAVTEGYSVRAVAFNPSGDRLATANLGSTAVAILDAVSGRRLRTLDGHAETVFSVAYSPDGSRLLSASLDKTAILWDVESGEKLFTYAGDSDELVCAAFSTDGRYIATGAANGFVRIWSTERSTEFPPLVGHTKTINHVAFSPDGRWIATASDDETARVWESNTGRETLTFTQGSAVNGLAFSPDSRRLATVNADGKGTVFDLSRGAEVLTLNGHSAAATSIVYSRDGLHLITGSDDRTARVWDAHSGKQLIAIQSDAGKIGSVDLNKDASRAAIAIELDTSAYQAASAEILDVRSGSILSKLQGDDVQVSQVAFNPDGKRLVTTGTSPPFMVKIWNTTSGENLLALSGHTGGILSAAFSPDGRALVTGGWDRTIKVWDAVDGFELLSLPAPNTSVTSLAYSPDGKRLAATGSGRTVNLYAMDPTELIVLAASRLVRPLSADECRRFLKRANCSDLASTKIVDGKGLLRMAQPEKAVALFRGALGGGKSGGIGPTAELLLSELNIDEARERSEVGDFAAAAQAYRTAVSMGPRGAIASEVESASWIASIAVNRAKQFITADNFREAIPVLQQAVALDPNNESGYLELDRAYVGTNEFGKAASAMRNAVRIRPSAPNVIEFADTLRINKDYSEAFTQIRKAIALDPRNERAHRVLAFLFLNTNDSDHALQEFKTAIAISPTKYSYSEVAGIYRSRKQFSLALETLKAAKAIDEKWVSAYADTADIDLVDLADYNAAYRELTAARNVAPDDAGLKADFAEACLAAGRFQEALDAANELLEAHLPNDKFSVSDRVAMDFIKLAALALLGNVSEANAAKQDLVEYFRVLPNYHQTWSYQGTRHFLSSYAMSETKRAALLQVLNLVDRRGGSEAEN